jgi:hypothetical protein
MAAQRCRAGARAARAPRPPAHGFGPAGFGQQRAHLGVQFVNVREFQHLGPGLEQMPHAALGGMIEHRAAARGGLEQPEIDLAGNGFVGHDARVGVGLEHGLGVQPVQVRKAVARHEMLDHALAHGPLGRYAGHEAQGPPARRPGPPGPLRAEPRQVGTPARRPGPPAARTQGNCEQSTASNCRA